MLIIGPSTSDILQVITSAAGTIKPELSWIIVDTSTPPVVQTVDSTPKADITTATTTNLIAGASGTKTRIGMLSLYNSDASVTNTVTVQLVDGSLTTPINQATLAPGESFIFTGTTWIHYDANGVPVLASAKLDVKLRVSSDVINATTSFADVTGLTVNLLAGKKYNFEAHLYHINNATTTGSRFGVNIGAAPTDLRVATIDTVTASVTASVHSAGSVTALNTAATAQTTGSAAVTMAILSGYIVPSADGTFAIRCQSEVAVAAGLTVKAGSWLRIWEADN